MNQNLLLRKSAIFISILFMLLFSALASKAQTQVPITLTGFNQDVIADSGLNQAIGSVVSISIDLPSNSGYDFFAQGYSAGGTAYPNGLPDNGQFTSTAGHNFQLAPYNGNNDLRLEANQSGTLVFSAADQNSYSNLYFLGTAGSGLTEVLYTIYFSDSSSISGALLFSDWYCPSCSEYAVHGLDRVSYVNGINEGNPNFDMFEVEVGLSGGNQSKVIDSVNFNVPNNQVGVANIFGITGILTSSLPVTLETFTLTQDGGNAVLNWKTAQELNSSKYIIQRANSINPNTFITIGTVKATSSPLGSSYSYVDNPGISGTYFYRLIEQDIDGKSEILGTKSITLNSNNTWAVEDFGNQWKLICPQPFKYRLIDMQGRVLAGATGSGSAIISKPGAAGIYELQVQTNGMFSARKIIK